MGSHRVETLRWHDDALELIDQRVLPARVEYVRCRSAREVAAAIRSMVVRGAPAIGCAAAFGVALAARESRSDTLDATMNDAFALLGASRPTAVNLFWAIERMRARWESVRGQSVQAIASTLLAEAEKIRCEDIAANQAIGRIGAALLDQRSRVLTHCNAGALATAGHGTALGVIRSAVQSGKEIAVFADETRPFLQGARLTAWELQQEGIPVTIIADGAAGALMSRGEIDAVIVGADRVAANGDVANKIGTYMVAVLAQRHHIPFYVACPMSTIDANVATGLDIPIEERDGAELTGFGATRWTPDNVAFRNPAFDITPAELITALITEHGLLQPPDRRSIAELLARGASC